MDGNFMAFLIRRRLVIIIISLFALFATAWVSFFLQRNHQLVGAGINRTFLFLLINVHILVLGFLLYVIIRQSVKLFIERKKGIPGTVFKRNLLFAFTLFSVIPSFFVFFTAGRLITRSIDDWFQVRIEVGLKKGILLHEKQTATERAWLSDAGRQLTDHLPLHDVSQLAVLRERIDGKAKSFGSHDVTPYVWVLGGGPCFGEIKDEMRVWRQFRKFNDRTIKSLCEGFFQKIAEINNEGTFDFYGSLYWVSKIGDYRVVLAKRYPPDIRYALIEIQNAVADYEQLKSMRNPIYLNYLFTFFLVMILILFLSIWCAFYLARGITKPIQDLLGAIAQIRKGRWDVQLSYQASDDLRILVEGFNEMMHTIQQAKLQLEGKHRELFIILENIRAAVFLVNSYGRVVMCNASARDMALRFIDTEKVCGKRINIFGAVVTKAFLELVRNLQGGGKQKVSQAIVLTLKGEEHFFVTTISFVMVNNLPKNFEQGALIVLEDVTEVVRANKLRTWQEAAKQMAHEIKNPLTPIQLATQRMQRRFGKTLCEDPVFFQCTDVILEQVALIKSLVVHFSEFATMPALKCEMTNLNKIVQEVACLYRLSYADILIEVELFEEMPEVSIDIKKIKRVLVNLFDNSIRALQARDGDKWACKQIKINTKMSEDGRWVSVLFADNGPGIAQEVRDKLFLPYVSTEKKNMGLGLAIVRDIIALHGGTICLIPSAKGAMFHVQLPIQGQG